MRRVKEKGRNEYSIKRMIENVSCLVKNLNRSKNFTKFAKNINTEKQRTIPKYILVLKAINRGETLPHA